MNRLVPISSGHSKAVALSESSQEHVQKFHLCHANIQEKLSRAIVQMEGETQALKLWKENALTASRQKLERTNAIIRAHDNGKVTLLQNLEKVQKESAAHHEEHIEEAQKQKEKLENSNQADKETLRQKEAAVAAENAKNQALNQALNHARSQL